jgi:hypothetical protein
MIPSNGPDLEDEKAIISGINRGDGGVDDSGGGGGEGADGGGAGAGLEAEQVKDKDKVVVRKRELLQVLLVVMAGTEETHVWCPGRLLSVHTVPKSSSVILLHAASTTLRVRQERSVGKAGFESSSASSSSSSPSSSSSCFPRNHL